MPSSPQQSEQSSPDYAGLVRFLLTPLLESPNTLSIDCEKANNSQRVWMRLAFEASDKGRVYGRGGRNIQAIRTLLNTSAASAAQSLYLEIYDGETQSSSKGAGRGGKREHTRQGKAEGNEEKNGSRRHRPSNAPKPSIKEK
jgi:hypothetical protein